MNSNVNVTVAFGPGTHYLNESLTVSNLNAFSMTSENITVTAQIECTEYSRIIFNNSQDILISNLEFVGCGGNRVTNVEHLMICDTAFTGQDSRGTTLQLIKTTAETINCAFSALYWSRTTGGAINAINSNISISQTNFENNGASIYQTPLTEHMVQSFMSSRVSFT